MPSTQRFPVVQPPPNPNFQYLKKRAKHLLREHRERNPAAFRRIKDFLPRLAEGSEDEIAHAKFTLQDAQLVVARETGYTTWANMKRQLLPRRFHVKVVNTWLLYYVHDMDRAKQFYMKTFEVKAIKETEGWTELDFGSMVLALHILPGHGGNVVPHAGLIIRVDDVHKTHDEIVRNGGKLIEKRDPKYFCFEDTEGNAFELC